MAYPRVAHGKSGMDSYWYVCYIGHTPPLSYSYLIWILEIGKKRDQKLMELLNLFLICFGCFGFFAIIEVVKLKKEVRRLNGITTHLLEKEKVKQESWEFV